MGDNPILYVVLYVASCAYQGLNIFSAKYILQDSARTRGEKEREGEGFF